MKTHLQQFINQNQNPFLHSNKILVCDLIKKDSLKNALDFNFFVSSVLEKKYFAMKHFPPFLFFFLVLRDLSEPDEMKTIDKRASLCRTFYIFLTNVKFESCRKMLKRGFVFFLFPTLK